VDTYHKMNKLIISNDIFFANVIEEINAGRAVKIPSKGNSMLPFIRPTTDMIELKPLNENSIKKGNIVLAKTNEDKYIVHRIEKTGQNSLILRGDGNIWIREICDKNNIFAEATAVYKKGRKISKGSLRWNLVKRCWFTGPLLRRIYLGIDRRINKIGKDV